MKKRNVNSKIVSESECEASYISTAIDDKQIAVVCSSDFRSAQLYKNLFKKFNKSIFYSLLLLQVKEFIKTMNNNSIWNYIKSKEEELEECINNKVYIY